MQNLVWKNKYRQGADYERKIVKSARDAGMIAFRSAGSHSPIDLCIIDKENQVIHFVQCKAGKSYSDTFKKALQEKYSFLNGNWLVSFMVR